MPTRDTPWPTGTPCWVDLAVPDVAAALDFYGPVMGWSFVDTGEEFGHYHLCRVGDRAAAAIGPPMQEGQPSAWTVYLASDDADRTAALVTEHGGTVVAPPFDVPGNGRMCVALDSTGAAFGVWQAGGTIGVEIYNEPGALVWEDALLADPDRGRTFYAAVFGHTHAPIEGAPPDYATFSVNGEVAGGIGGMMGAPPGTPGHWLPYFSVSDIHAATDAAGRSGATMLQAPQSTPFGWMAALLDPFGGAFSLHAPPA